MLVMPKSVHEMLLILVHARPGHLPAVHQQLPGALAGLNFPSLVVLAVL